MELLSLRASAPNYVEMELTTRAIIVMMEI